MKGLDSLRRDHGTESPSDMGTFFLFLSWVGFFFKLLVLISVHSLAVSRKERKLFSSDLKTQDLAVEPIQEILKECE